MHKNSDFTIEIHEIYIELSENLQRYENEYCESESDGKIDGFSTGCYSWTMDHYHNHGGEICYIKEVKMKPL
jgi:hypothetical protein